MLHIVKSQIAELKGLLSAWPVAADNSLIVNPANAIQKMQRGEDIIELMIETDLAGKRFLDFGCGEGHSVLYASRQGALLAVGYDLGHQGTNGPGLFYTVSWEEVTARGPYDVILMYDVLDHLVDETPASALARMRSVLAADGCVYARVHPWTSRHAIHQYHDFNKAYAHLVFSEEELQDLIRSAQHLVPNTAKVRTPFITYKALFEEAGLSIRKQRAVKDVVEPFFHTPVISGRILKGLGFDEFPEFQMSVVFIDYVLEGSRATTAGQETEE